MGKPQIILAGSRNAVNFTFFNKWIQSCGSPPMRGRGLKPPFLGIVEYSTRSPPMRGRGLKRREDAQELRWMLSPPMRGRGLKQRTTARCRALPLVAPHAGARIETSHVSNVPP